MATTSRMFLAFGLIVVLAIASQEISAQARLAEGKVPFEQVATRLSLSGDSVGSCIIASGDPSQDVAPPFKFLGESLTKPMEVHIKGKSPQETEDGLDLKLLSDPGFSVINSMDQLNVTVQCFNDFIANPPMIVDYIIPVGGHQDWDLNDIDPSHPHERYLCNFLQTGCYNWKQMSYQVWSRIWDGNVQPFLCIHCFYKVANDGLYVWVQTHNPPVPQDYVKVTSWLSLE